MYAIQQMKKMKFEKDDVIYNHDDHAEEIYFIG